MDDNKLIKVRNRNNGSTGYELRDSHVVRKFESGQTKEITFGELRELSYIPGGEYIIQNLLVIEDEEALYENLENLMSESQISDTAIIINECIEENPDIISSSLTYERSYIFDGELIYFIMTDSEGNEYEVIPVPDSEQLTNDSKLTVKLRTRKDGEAKVFCEKKQTSL